MADASDYCFAVGIVRPITMPRRPISRLNASNFGGSRGLLPLRRGNRGATAETATCRRGLILRLCHRIDCFWSLSTFLSVDIVLGMAGSSSSFFVFYRLRFWRSSLGGCWLLNRSLIVVLITDLWVVGFFRKLLLGLWSRLIPQFFRASGLLSTGMNNRDAGRISTLIYLNYFLLSILYWSQILFNFWWLCKILISKIICLISWGSRQCPIFTNRFNKIRNNLKFL